MLVPSRVHAAQPEILSICNKGDARLNVATVVYDQSLLFGNSYQVKGWYEVDPGKCETVYSSDDRDPVYLGFTYRDFKNTLRLYQSDPRKDSAFFKAASINFCVSPNDAFNYKTPTKEAAQSCKPGLQPLEFSLSVSGVPDDYDRLSYDMFPSRTDTDSPVFGWLPPAGAIPKLSAPGTRNANLQLAQIVAWNFGGDQKWYYENGAPIPDAFHLTAVQESPLFDQRFKDDKIPADGFGQKINQLVAVVKSQLFPGTQLLDNEDLGWLCEVFNERYYCAPLYALDFQKAEFVDDAGFPHLMIPCLSGIVRGGDPNGDALCSIHSMLWKASDGEGKKTVFIGQDMNLGVQTDMLFVVANADAAKATLSALTELAAEFEKYYEPKPVRSIPVQ